MYSKSAQSAPGQIRQACTQNNRSSVMWNLRRLNKSSRPGKKNIFVGTSGLALIAEAAFVKMLHVEQKRTERSSRRFALMLLECRSLRSTCNSAETLDNLLLALLNATRETDIRGGYKDGSC